MKKFLTLAGVTALVVIAVSPSGGFAQSPKKATEALDCIIEPHAIIRIGSRVDGVIERIEVDRGDIVKKDQVLARLESGMERVEVEMAAARVKGGSAVLASQARLENLRRQAHRIEKLFEKKVASGQALDEAVTNKVLAELELKEAKLASKLRKYELKRARQALQRRTIRSPISGIVQEKMMSPGEFAHEQSPLMRIAQIHPLNVEVFVPLSLYGSITEGMKAEVMPVKPIGGTHAAKVVIVDKIFDAASGTFGVRLELPNPEFRLPAGIKCRVRFTTK